MYVLSYLINYYYYKEVDINYLKINCFYGKDGISLFNLKSMVSENGFKLDLYFGEFDVIILLNK